jgi:hypothetical protein
VVASKRQMQINRRSKTPALLKKRSGVCECGVTSQ